MTRLEFLTRSRSLAAFAFAAAAASAHAQQFNPPPQFRTAPAAPAPAADAAPALPPLPRMDPDAVLADNGIAKVTRADYDLELTKLPPEIRGGFATNERRVADLIARMLVTKTMAVQADKDGLPAQPENARRLAVEVEKVKAQMTTAKLEADANARFDANLKAWEARARDLYLADPSKYTVPAQAVASHILFATDKRSVEEATKLAQETRAKLVAGADFATLAKQLSDEPAAKTSGGSLGSFTKGKMVPEFEVAVFSMKPGEISQPVKTSFGVHIIRADKVTPERRLSFEEARPQILADLRRNYVASERDRTIGTLADQARESTNQDLVQAMVIRVDPAVLEQIQRQATEAMRRGAQPR